MGSPLDFWGTDANFLEGKRVVSHFKVINDAAERAVQLASWLLQGNQITHDESTRQLLMLVVAEDRKRHKLV